MQKITEIVGANFEGVGGKNFLTPISPPILEIGAENLRTLRAPPCFGILRP